MAERSARRRPAVADGQHLDQAAGLRRLFARRAAQAIAFIPAMEAGARNELLLNTAAALADSGSSVLLLEEQAGAKSMAARLRLRAQADLLQLVRGEATLFDILTQVTPLIGYIPAQRLARDLHQARLLPDVMRSRLRAHLQRLQNEAEFILINAAETRSTQVSPLALAADHQAIVVAAHSASITRAYALIKRLSQESGLEHFQIVVSQVRGETEARAIFANMRQLASRQLGVRLNHLATVPSGKPTGIAQALLTRLPRAAYGEIPGDWEALSAAAEHPAEESQFAIR